MRSILLAAVLVACSKGSSAVPSSPSNTATPAPPPKASAQTPEERVRARIAEIHAACAAGKTEQVIGMIVYRGDDEPRRWKTPMRPDDKDARKAADELCGGLRGPAPTMTKFESETESEGTWLIGMIEMNGEKAAFAFLEIDGALLLGDID